MRKARAGSVIQTSDDALWYCWGSWQLKETLDSYPCMLGYVPEDTFPAELQKIKTINVNGRVYVKVFGYFGQPLEVHRTILMRSRNEIVHPVSFGRLYFVKRSHIKAVQDPKEYVNKFLTTMEGAPKLFSSLVEILGVCLGDIGITGSTLTINAPSWRHEIDFFVYGRDKSKKLYRAIQDHRDDKIFSKKSLPPYHMPFEYQGKWFDPQFSEGDQEKPLLSGAALNVVRMLKDITLTICDDQNGVFYPPVYIVEQSKKLISFKPSHRKLFIKGQQIFFPSLSLVRLHHVDGSEETAYAILHDEWGKAIN